MRNRNRDSAKLRVAVAILMLAPACASTRAAIPLPSIFRPKVVTPVERAVASWYGDSFDGKRTASGERFDPDAFTCAHRDLPFGTVLRVRNPRNGATAVVTVNDRGPFAPGRDLDLSRAAARRLGLVSDGVAEVEIEILERGDGSTAARSAASGER